MLKRRSNIVKCLGLCLAILMVVSGCSSDQPTSPASTAQTEGDVEVAEDGKTYNGIDISEEVTIVMYLIGDEQPDAPMVYEEVNKKLKEDINATVEVKYLSWADWQQKYPLVFAAGEEFDLIYTGDWVFYAEQANKNAFMEVTTDMVQTYMPQYYDQVPNDFWNQLKINDKVYMIPYLNKQVVGHNMVMIRGDLREKYGLDLLETTDDLREYMLRVAENESGMKAYEGASGGVTNLINNILYKQERNQMFLNNFFTVSLEADSDGTLTYIFDDPEYIELLKLSRELAEGECWSKNTLAIQTGVNENFKAGTSAILPGMSEQMIQYTGEVNTLHPEFVPEVYDFQPTAIHQSSSAARSGMAINANSKNYERALMMMNLFGTDKSYYDLTTYGIEGVHYEPVGDNKMTSLPQGATSFPAKTNCPWGWESKLFMRYPDVVSDEVIAFEENWISNGLASTTPLVSFSFIDTEVVTEIAACNNIYDQHAVAIINGMFEDVDEEVEKLKAELEQAGIEKIREELQNQVNAYLATMN